MNIKLLVLLVVLAAQSSSIAAQELERGEDELLWKLKFLGRYADGYLGLVRDFDLQGRFAGDLFTISTRREPIYDSTDGEIPPYDDRATVHTTFGDNTATLASGAVKIANERWQGNRGFVISRAREGQHGGTYGFIVRSAVPMSGAKDSGVWVGNSAESMSFFLLDPESHSSISPMVLTRDGSFRITTIDPSTREQRHNIFVRAETGGQVGIHTKWPKATLDVNGTARLARYSAPPLESSCDSYAKGTIAMTVRYTLCVCNGNAWVSTNDGVSACLWK